jgi:hypothetical protein
MKKLLPEIIVWVKIIGLTLAVLLAIWWAITGQGDPCGPMDTSGC